MRIRLYAAYGYPVDPVGMEDYVGRFLGAFKGRTEDEALAKAIKILGWNPKDGGRFSRIEKGDLIRTLRYHQNDLAEAEHRVKLLKNIITLTKRALQ